MTITESDFARMSWPAKQKHLAKMRREHYDLLGEVRRLQGITHFLSEQAHEAARGDETILAACAVRAEAAAILAQLPPDPHAAIHAAVIDRETNPARREKRQ